MEKELRNLKNYKGQRIVPSQTTEISNKGSFKQLIIIKKTQIKYMGISQFFRLVLYFLYHWPMMELNSKDSLRTNIKEKDKKMFNPQTKKIEMHIMQNQK